MFCFSLGDIFANLSISCGYRSRFIALLDYLKPCFCKLFVIDECRSSVQKTFSISQESGDKQTTVRHQTSNRVLPESLKYTSFLLLQYKVMRVGSVTFILLPLFSENLTKLEDLHTYLPYTVVSSRQGY